MKVYNGQGSYIYISYAHRDFEKVEPFLNEFYKRGYNIWYDIGIEAGTEWIEYNAINLLIAGSFKELTEYHKTLFNVEMSNLLNNRKNVIAIALDFLYQQE